MDLQVPLWLVCFPGKEGPWLHCWIFSPVKSSSQVRKRSKIPVVSAPFDEYCFGSSVFCVSVGSWSFTCKYKYIDFWCLFYQRISDFGYLIYRIVCREKEAMKYWLLEVLKPISDAVAVDYSCTLCIALLNLWVLVAFLGPVTPVNCLFFLLFFSFWTCNCGFSHHRLALICCKTPLLWGKSFCLCWHLLPCGRAHTSPFSPFWIEHSDSC